MRDTTFPNRIAHDLDTAVSNLAGVRGNLAVIIRLYLEDDATLIATLNNISESLALIAYSVSLVSSELTGIPAAVAIPASAIHPEPSTVQ